MNTEFSIAEVMPGKLNALVKNIMRQTGTDDPNEAVRLVNSGEWVVSKLLKKTTDIIHVDRSVRPSYPDWMKEIVYPELENTGPAEYDISLVEQWLHEDQKKGKWIEGNKIHSHLKNNDTLKTCLGLRDLEEIQKKGAVFFRKYFQDKAVFAWKSVVRNRGGSLGVPFLYEDGGVVVMRWSWLDHGWYGSRPALRVASSTKA